MLPVVFIFLAVISAIVSAYQNELIIQEGIQHVVKNPTPKIPRAQLPSYWDWREKGLLTTDLNQHIPQYCGSCWAHASMSTIADRIKIMTNGTMRDVIPSIQVLINCGHAGTCNGGDANAAFAWVHKNGIPEVTCQQYQAKNMECNAMNTCMTCDHDGTCRAIESFPVITVSEFGAAYGDDEIMAEIYSRGPVAVNLNAECIETYSGGINMYDSCNTILVNHVVQLVGWGTENGVDYWIGRNSWGTYWGEHGFFRIVRGGNYNPHRGFWAVPDVPKF